MKGTKYVERIFMPTFNQNPMPNALTIPNYTIWHQPLKIRVPQDFARSVNTQFYIFACLKLLRLVIRDNTNIFYMTSLAPYIYFLRWGKQVKRSDFGCLASACSLHFTCVSACTPCTAIIHDNTDESVKDQSEQQSKWIPNTLP